MQRVCLTIRQVPVYLCMSTCVLSLSHSQLCDPMDCSPQAPLSMGFPRQEYWGLPFPSPGDLPDLGIKPEASVAPALAGRFFTTGPPGKPVYL